MSHAHVFDEKGFYLIPSANRNKLDDNSWACLFLGVLPHGDGVTVLDLITKKIIKTRDVHFGSEGVDSVDEPVNPSLSSPKASDAPWLFPGEQAYTQPDKRPPSPTPPPLPRPTRTRREPQRYGNIIAHSAELGSSPTYKMAMQSSENAQWRDAMQSEIDVFIARNVFTLVPKPANSKTILCKWHLKKKLNLDGSLKKFKARLVARGFTQREGIDYQETFAPSSRQESLKAFLAVNGHRDWDMIQLDVVGAFLYGDLDEEIYLSQPEGFIDPTHPTHVWRLNSSLYGIKQSARQWNKCLVDQLKAIGF